MAVGNGVPFMGYDSCIGLSQETTYGTYVTATSWIEFNSESFKMTKEELKMESLNMRRDYTKRVLGNDTVEGSLECDLIPDNDGMMWLIKSAMGGTVSTAAPISTGVYLHTFNLGDTFLNDSSVSATDTTSLSFAVRRGLTHVFAYTGMKVNSLTLKAEVGGPVMMTAEMIGKGHSICATVGAVAYSTQLPAIFKGVSVKMGATISAASTERYYTAFEWTLNNNLEEQRSLGSRSVTVLPGGKREISLKLTQRFDTSTAYDEAMANTATAFVITLDSEQTITAACQTTSKILINIGAAYLNLFQHEVGGPETIMQELEYTCMYQTDPGYVCTVQCYNGTTGY